MNKVNLLYIGRRRIRFGLRFAGSRLAVQVFSSLHSTLKAKLLSLRPAESSEKHFLTSFNKTWEHFLLLDFRLFTQQVTPTTLKDYTEETMNAACHIYYKAFQYQLAHRHKRNQKRYIAREPCPPLTAVHDLLDPTRKCNHRVIEVAERSFLLSMFEI